MAKNVSHHIVKFHKSQGIDGKEISKQTFFPILIDSIEDLFKDPESFLSQLSPDARENSYYTLAKRSGRSRLNDAFVRQEHLAFDIDGIDTNREEETAHAVCEILQVPFDKVGVVATGNGVQIIIRLKSHIDDVDFFKKHKSDYDLVCTTITAGLKARGIPGEADKVIFDQARVLRMPGTVNNKPNKPTRKARTLNSNIEPLEYSLSVVAGGDSEDDDETLKKSPTYPDTETILKECEFIKWVDREPEAIKEPQWYAAASIYARLENGRNLFHETSQKSKRYDRGVTEAKFEQAEKASGPRLCRSIEKLWDGCKTCVHYGKCKSPVNIQGKSYIKTRNTGFRSVVKDPTTGQFVTGPVIIEDVVKFFEQKNKYIIDPATKDIFVYTGTHYKQLERIQVEAFAEKHIERCRNREANEFTNKVFRREVTDTDWLRSSTDGKMNFLNGILNVHTLEFREHTADIGFRFVLPYTYDPTATAPRFDKFLDEVTCGDPDYRKTLLEFGGYCLSNDPYWDHKALVLLGEGSNGKSLFTNVLKSLADGYYSSVRLGQMQNDQYIANLDRSLFNVSEESNSGGFKETDNFKALASGGEVEAKVVFKPVYKFVSKAKLIFLANDMPWNRDDSFGFKRRFIIVKFNATFEGVNKDPFLLEKLIKERAGIINMFLTAYRDMKKRGRCHVGAKSEEALEEYGKEHNPIHDWFEDTYDYGDMGDMVISGEAYDSFVSYCTANGHKYIPHSTAFSKQLTRAFPKLIHSRMSVDRKQQRVIRGIKKKLDM